VDIRNEEGDKLTVKVKRINVSGKLEERILGAPIMKVEKIRKHVLRFKSHSSAEQSRMRTIRLNNYALAPLTFNEENTTHLKLMDTV